ncbi:MAG: heat-inducible transcription repressor HrcA [bacterium]|nr:MAG: heat-inducible transcription repressor HrcA [bacterium]
MSPILKSERHHEILMALIRFYIGTAEPVGSKTLVERRGLAVSPATVRGVLAELEAEGYLSQPHTSAGRVPTEKAYRYYVDNLLGQRFTDPRSHINNVRLAIKGFSGVGEDLLKWTSRVLSDMSRYAGIVLPPKRVRSLFKKVTFVRINRDSVLTVLVSVSGVTRNKLVRTSEDFSQSALDSMSNYLNLRYTGMSLEEMRRRVEEDLEQDLESFDLWMKAALNLGKRMFDGPETEEVYVEGGSRFLDMPEFISDLEGMRGIFRLFEEKRGLVALLDQTIKAHDMMVFIGSETGMSEMKGMSLVVSTYGRNTGPLGAVGVMGPSRMDYNQVIPLVRSAAEAVSENFSATDNHQEENI